MKIYDKSIAEVGFENWQAFVESHPNGSIYHHPLWHRVIERTYGFKTVYRVKSGEKDIACALPFVPVRKIFTGWRNISYPFSDYCDPLVTEPGEVFELIRCGQGFSGNEQTELRLFKLSKKKPDEGYSTFILDLSQGEKNIYDALHGNCIKRPIKRASKKGIEITEANSPESLRDFYRLHVLTRKKHGVPVQPFDFFRNIWEALYPAGMMDLFVAKSGNTALSSIIILRFKDKAYYKFGASDERHSGTGANQALMWAGIMAAIKKGCRSFDLGRTLCANKGLMEYKARWGAEQYGLTYVKFPGGGSNAVKEGGGLDRIGSWVLKKMPGISLRLFGELFYKYLA